MPLSISYSSSLRSTHSSFPANKLLLYPNRSNYRNNNVVVLFLQKWFSYILVSDSSEMDLASLSASEWTEKSSAI